MSYERSAYPRTCQYIASIGIDPTMICVDGVTLGGYFEYATDDDGKRIRDGDTLVRWVCFWPTPIVGGIVLWLMRQDRKGKRL